jgi:hypothetical protein
MDVDGDVIFHDSQADPLTHLEGPVLSHFRSSSVKEESKLIEMAWQECINKAKSSTIILPLSQIKTFSCPKSALVRFKKRNRYIYDININIS